MRIRDVPRDSDERLLEWIARRLRGDRCVDIARDWGVTSNNVRDATNRVKDADMAESGENVKGEYW